MMNIIGIVSFGLLLFEIIVEWVFCWLLIISYFVFVWRNLKDWLIGSVIWWVVFISFINIVGFLLILGVNFGGILMVV